jgi:hypothetical protein
MIEYQLTAGSIFLGCKGKEDETFVMSLRTARPTDKRLEQRIGRR